MAVVSLGVTPDRTFSPFEGMSEAQRLVTAVPRGLIRFHSNIALAGKPVNDSVDLTYTCSLQPSFAYVLSSLSFEITVDTASDWDATCRFRAFNALPNVLPGNNQVALFNMGTNPNAVSVDPARILDYSLGDVRAWFPQPLVRSQGAAGMSLILQYHNSAAAVGAAMTSNFSLALYQYELNQAVRFPLNSPFPVGIR